MSGFDWPGILRAGVRGLGLAPAQVWALTPWEFLLLIGRDTDDAPMGRAGLDALMRAFPDAPDCGGPDGRAAKEENGT